MVHLFKKNGYNIALDVNSGCVHAVDEVAYDIIGMYETHTKEEIVEEILKKYAGCPDVTREDILGVLEDVESLFAMAQAYSVCQDGTQFRATCQELNRRILAGMEAQELNFGSIF